RALGVARVFGLARGGNEQAQRLSQVAELLVAIGEIELGAEAWIEREALAESLARFCVLTGAREVTTFVEQAVCLVGRVLRDRRRREPYQRAHDHESAHAAM